MFLHATLKLLPSRNGRLKDPTLAAHWLIMQRLCRSLSDEFKGNQDLEIDLVDDGGSWHIETIDASHDLPIGEPVVYITISCLLQEPTAHLASKIVDSLYRELEELINEEGGSLSESDFEVESSATLDPSTTILIRQVS